jgi:ribonuclease HI
VKILKKNHLYIYTDGASLQRPRRGGIGIRYIYLDETEEEHYIDLDLEGYVGATNNQMELLAVIEGIKNSVNQNIPIKYNEIEIRTDSRYVVDNKNNALYNWPKNNWFNKYGKPIENADLWKSLIREIKSVKCRVEIIWVKGHGDDPHNRTVDKLAKKSAQAYLKKPIVQSKIRRKKSKKLTRRGSIEMNGQRISIYIITEQYLKPQKLSKYRCEVISKGSEYHGNIDFINSELHQLKAGHKYFVILNKDNNNPRILKLIKELK